MVVIKQKAHVLAHNFEKSPDWQYDNLVVQATATASLCVKDCVLLMQESQEEWTRPLVGSSVSSVDSTGSVRHEHRQLKSFVQDLSLRALC